MYGQYIVLFAIVITGYILRKINFIDDSMNNGLNKFIVYFAYPCMIVLNLGGLDVSRQLLFHFLIMLGMSLLSFALYSVWMYYYCKFRQFPKDVSNIVELSSVCPNDGFMGFPIALLFFGGQGFLLMLAHNAAMNFYFFSYGIIALRRNKAGGGKRNPRTMIKSTLKVLVNPNVIALFIGFAISMTGIDILGPHLMGMEINPIERYLSLIGNVATPMAMIFIGSTLAGCNFFEIIRDHMVLEATLNKLILLPLLTFAAVFFLPIAPIIKAILVLACCFPAAATVSMVAQQEGENQVMAGKILFFSTVISIATIPLSINIINAFIM